MKYLSKLLLFLGWMLLVLGLGGYLVHSPFIYSARAGVYMFALVYRECGQFPWACGGNIRPVEPRED